MPAPRLDAEQLIRALRGAGCVFAEEEAALLLAEAPDDDSLRRMLGERVAGRPLEQVVGWAAFDGLRITVLPGVFVPRTRSLLLVRLAEEHLRRQATSRDRPVVVDLCSGTAALGTAVLARCPDVEVHAADLDPVAVACSRTNLADLADLADLAMGAVHAGDLYDALPGHLRGRVDVLLANAPYVPTHAIAEMPPEARDHEHHAALDGGADGHDVQRRVVAGAVPWLSPTGVLLVETGRTMASTTAALMASVGLQAVEHVDPEIQGCAVAGSVV